VDITREVDGHGSYNVVTTSGIPLAQQLRPLETISSYQRLADLLQRDELDGLRDATTIGQLASIRYELDGSGRIKIESKESARHRGVRSPDRADALMLALGNHRPEITMKDLLILPKRAQGGAYTYGIGDDNGIDDPKPRRYERADRPGLWKW
jgi:hypothetical protein